MIMMRLTKPMRSQAIKGIVARQLAIQSHHAEHVVSGNPMLRPSALPTAAFTAPDIKDCHTPMLVTNVPRNESFIAPAPVTGTLIYDIMESPLHFKVAVKIPKTIRAENLTVEVEQGNKALRVTGHTSNDYCTKRFSWGDILDVKSLAIDFRDGVLVIQAPKIHYLNGNAPYN